MHLAVNSVLRSGGRVRWARAAAALGFGLLLTACGAQTRSAGPAKPPSVQTASAGYSDLAGWSDDAVAAAVPVFLKSCARIATQPDHAPLDTAVRHGEFGKVGDWRPLCRQAAALPAGDDRAARQFFEANFVPVAAQGAAAGTFTGYYEAEFQGSRVRDGRFQVPVYRKPSDLVSGRPYLDRAAIENGALGGRSLEVVWLEEPDDVLVLQTQGSGRIKLPDGSTVRLVYEANNSRPTVSVFDLMQKSGAIPLAQFSNAAVRAWMRQNPEKAKAIRQQNPAYVFFKEHNGEGPIGAQGAVLTPERSLAVDHKYVPLGVPLWLEARGVYQPTSVKRLVVAQDTGDGIEGPVRGDYYWGSGAQAAARGGDFYASGRYYLMLPRKIAMAAANRQLASR